MRPFLKYTSYSYYFMPCQAEWKEDDINDIIFWWKNKDMVCHAVLYGLYWAEAAEDEARLQLLVS